MAAKKKKKTAAKKGASTAPKKATKVAAKKARAKKAAKKAPAKKAPAKKAAKKAPAKKKAAKKATAKKVAKKAAKKAPAKKVAKKATAKKTAKKAPAKKAAKKATAKKANTRHTPVFLLIHLPQGFSPIDRAERFEDPLEMALGPHGVLSGGGTSIDEDGNPMSADIELEIYDMLRALPIIRRVLVEQQAPQGSVVTRLTQGGDFEILFGMTAA